MEVIEKGSGQEPETVRKCVVAQGPDLTYLRDVDGPDAYQAPGSELEVDEVGYQVEAASQ